MAQLIKQIQNYAFQSSLWEKGSKIVLGVSGGPDSVCLLEILNRLSGKYDFELHIVHVNYNLRGADSKKDELLVKTLAEKYGIKASFFAPKKSEYKGNLENGLRKIRYDYFEKVRKQLGFDLIAVAHNQDDQAETILMRIIRGSGLSGLGAMKAKTGKIIRPLLSTSRAEILAFLKQNKLQFRIDKSNMDTKFMRNRIRHGLLPYLEKNFNPAVKKTLSEWAVSVADDYEFIAENAERFVQTVCKNKYAFSVDLFISFHPAIQRQILRNLMVKIKNSSIDIENKQIDEMIKVIKSKKSKAQKASIGGLVLTKKDDKVKLA